MPLFVAYTTHLLTLDVFAYCWNS